MAWSPVGGQKVAVHPRGQYRVQSCSKPSLMIWMMMESITSARLMMTHNWEGCLIHQRVVLPSRGSLSDWSWADRKLRHINKGKCQVLHSEKSKPSTRACWGLASQEAHWQEKTYWTPSWRLASKGWWYPGLHKEERCQQTPLSTSGAIPGVLCQVLDCQVQETLTYEGPWNWQWY